MARELTEYIILKPSNIIRTFYILQPMVTGKDAVFNSYSLFLLWIFTLVARWVRRTLNPPLHTKHTYGTLQRCSFQNCYFIFTVINGGWSVWSADGQCSLSCGGGVQFKIRTCTNPKPSVNGRNCNGAAKEIAEKKWCNTQVNFILLNWGRNS